MAKITVVDYEAIPGKAKQMRSKGQELNSVLTKTYASLTSMHNNWYGKRYNSLIQVVNSVIPSLNEMLQLVVGEIPFALETVANNYSQADTGSNCTSASNEAPNKITDIAMPNDVGMRFLTAEVTATKQEVSNNFKNSESLMNNIEQIFDTVTWESEAAQAFREKFKRLKGEIISSFQDIEENFSKLMQQALEDIQASENANTVS